MNAAMLKCGWNQTEDLTSLHGELPNGRDMTCLIVSVWMLPCWCVAGIRQETWHLYLEGCQMAEIWRVLLSVYECCHVEVWLESNRRPDISTWRAAKWQRSDVSYCQCMNAAMLMCGWNQTGDLTSLPGGLPNGRDMTCLIVSVWMLPCWCVAGIRQETWHLYLEGCQMAEIWHVLLSVYECCHVDVWLDRRPDISTWRAAKWQRYDVSYCQCMNAAMLMCGWNQTGDLTSLPGGLPNGRDMTCLIAGCKRLRGILSSRHDHDRDLVCIKYPAPDSFEWDRKRLYTCVSLSIIVAWVPLWVFISSAGYLSTGVMGPISQNFCWAHGWKLSSH